MTTTPCARCGRPTADALVCHTDALELAQALTTAAGHAEDAAALAERGTRIGGARGGNGDTPLPDLTRSRRYHRAANAIGTWARVAIEETGRRPRWRVASGPLCPATGTRCAHGSCDAIRRRTAPDPVALSAAWLARQVGWLRQHPAAGEAFTELHDACAELARLVDVPPEKDLVGMCDCGKVLYAERGKTLAQCPRPTCKLVWNVEESRDILRRNLGDRLVTAPEAARLAAYLDGDRTQDNIRKLIAARVRTGQLLAHGQVDNDDAEEREPTYRFSDVAALLAGIPKRERRAAA